MRSTLICISLVMARDGGGKKGATRRRGQVISWAGARKSARGARSLERATQGSRERMGTQDGATSSAASEHCEVSRRSAMRRPARASRSAHRLSIGRCGVCVPASMPMLTPEALPSGERRGGITQGSKLESPGNFMLFGNPENNQSKQRFRLCLPKSTFRPLCSKAFRGPFRPWMTTLMAKSQRGL